MSTEVRTREPAGEQGPQRPPWRSRDVQDLHELFCVSQDVVSEQRRGPGRPGGQEGPGGGSRGLADGGGGWRTPAPPWSPSLSAVRERDNVSLSPPDRIFFFLTINSFLWKMAGESRRIQASF